MSHCGCSCGSIRKAPSAAPPPEVFEPLVIMGSASVVAGWDARTVDTSPVGLWDDSSGNGFDLTATEPTWNATGGPNSQPSVLFDGINDIAENLLLDLPAPGTTPTFYWAVIRQVSWTPLDILFGAAGGLLIRQFAGSPNIGQQNPTGPVNAHGGLTVNTFLRLESYFSNSVSDYIKAGSAIASTGANAGNTDPTAGFALGNLPSAGSDWANIEVCEFWIFNVLPSTTQKAALDAYVTSRYGAGLV
jgi:hypothetical protein